MAKGRGGGKTPQRVQDLINEAFQKKSQNAVARESGLTLSSIQRYAKGIGEPSQATLEKLAEYFQVSVAYLRGKTVNQRIKALFEEENLWLLEKMADDLFEIHRIIPDELKKTIILTLSTLRDDMSELLLQSVAGCDPKEEKSLSEYIDKIDVFLDKHSQHKIIRIDNFQEATISAPGRRITGHE